MKERQRQKIQLDGPTLKTKDILKVVQAEMAELHEAFMKVDVQRALFVQMLTAILNADYDGTRVITLEELAAAEKDCGFQFIVLQEKRDDGRVDHKLVLVRPPTGDSKGLKPLPKGPHLIT